MRMSAVETKPHLCNMCGGILIEPDRSVTYKEENVNTKLHLCSICGEAFTHLDGLRTHEEEHTDRKSHLCSMCGEGFTDLDHLLTHEAVHRREQEFVCVECGKIFTLEASLDKHLCPMNEDLSPDTDLQDLKTGDFLNTENCNAHGEIRGKLFPADCSTTVVQNEHRMTDGDDTSALKSFAADTVKRKKYGTRSKNDKSGGERNLSVGEDEIVVNKVEWEQLQKEVKELRKKSQTLNAGKLAVVVPEKAVKEGIRNREADGEDMEKTPKQKTSYHQPLNPSRSRRFKTQMVETEKVKKKLLPKNSLRDRQCMLCNKIYHSHASLARHFSMFHKKECIYYCKKCGKGFISSSPYKRHVAAHDVGSRLICEASPCSKTFRSKPALKNHRTEQHGPKPALKNHRTEQHGPRPAMNNHRTEQHGPKPALKNHRTEQHGPKKKPMTKYGCKSCKFRSSTIGAVNQHYRNTHPPIACDYCSKVYNCPSSLKKHLYVHQTVKPFSCNICGAAFVFNSELKYHQYVHMENRSYLCQHAGCTKSFCRESDLTAHVRVHSGICWSCDLCNYTTPDQRLLKTHMRCHEEPRCQCRYCAQRFKYGVQRTRHEKKEHQLMA